MRETRLTSDFIAYRYTIDKSPFWDACASGFEQMFKPRLQDLDRIAPHRYSDKITNNKYEVLQTNSESSQWDWYVDKRIDYIKNRNGEYPSYHFENKMYKWFSSIGKNDSKPILLIHGRTGIGKTTFVRHFFSFYLQKIDHSIANNTYILRIAMPVIGYSERRAEEEFDHNVYRFLVENFTSGNNNLHSPKILMDIAKYAYPNEDWESAKQDIPTPPKSYQEQLKWIREKIVARTETKKGEEKPVSDWADFNRLAINYLCITNPKLRIVFFLDNVDHLPPQYQKAVWLVARQKLHWVRNWSSISFVITIRSYLLENASKEDTLQAYRDKLEEFPLFPPSLHDILNERKKSGFDPLYPKRTPNNNVRCTIALNKNKIPIYCPNEFLSSFLNVFKERGRNFYISQFCNYDIRQGLEIAKNIFQYPFYNWKNLIDEIHNQFQNRATDFKLLISYEKILEALLRNRNLLCESKVSFFDNIFMVDKSNHFSNSLCKLFILKMLNQRSYSVKDILQILYNFGHPKHIIENAIQRLLLCNIISSPQGIYLKEDHLEIITSDETTLCKKYSEYLPNKLIYLQAMAYMTPLEEKFAEQIPLPSEISDDSRSFKDRVLAAKFLLDQIISDFNKQINYINQNGDEATIEKNMKLFSIYGFNKIIISIKKGVTDDLLNLLRTDTFAIEDQNELTGLFRI
ncbi:MAG: hypothetical protein GF364_09910 [Candidatus Lokiarchaeota archaeon]|nr:hypothetical protein [Candidatus Lokiarchaeota archaeon]